MPTAGGGAQTLYDKVFQDHIVDERLDGTILLYIDRHLVHEVTSPQAFEGLKNAGREVRRPDCTLATTDHVSPRSIIAPTREAVENLLLLERPHHIPENTQEHRNLCRGGRLATPMYDPRG